MSYFANFPKILWNDYLINDITFRVSIIESAKVDIGAWEPYRVKENQHIEELAHKLYGSPNFDWVIMLMNNIIDPIYDWPLNQEELDKYTTAKYGSGNESNIHHWEEKGRIFTSDQGFSVAISNAEFEDKENENNREIILLKPEYLSNVISEFNSLIASYKYD